MYHFVRSLYGMYHIAMSVPWYVSWYCLVCIMIYIILPCLYHDMYHIVRIVSYVYHIVRIVHVSYCQNCIMCHIVRSVSWYVSYCHVCIVICIMLFDFCHNMYRIVKSVPYVSYSQSRFSILLWKCINLFCKTPPWFYHRVDSITPRIYLENIRYRCRVWRDKHKILL
jgi:hypothetical protein